MKKNLRTTDQAAFQFILSSLFLKAMLGHEVREIGNTGPAPGSGYGNQAGTRITGLGREARGQRR